MNEMNQVKKSSQLRDADKKVLLAYANLLTDIETTPKPVNESTVIKHAYKIG